MDDGGQSYQIIMLKSAGENVSGGTINVQFFVGSHVEKL